MRIARAARLAARLAGRIMAPAGAAVALALLAGCGRIGSPLDALGGRVPPPDEFQVMQHEPPVIPETFSLPEPTPGTSSPRLPDPEQQAVAALLGPEAARARGVAAEPTAGEQELLASADAAAASGDIRVQLEADLEETPEGPYEPPTVWELLGFGDDEEIDESQIIDPAEEARRLQAQGVPTPVDPDAEARAAAEAAEADEPAPEPIDRRPTNRIGPPVEPAF